MFMRNGVQCDGMTSINCSEVMVGDVIKTFEIDGEVWGTCDRHGRDVGGDEYTWVIYQINPHGIYGFDWSTETFGHLDPETALGNWDCPVLLIDHKPKSATKASSFAYEQDSVFASECRYGHYVSIDDDTTITAWQTGGRDTTFTKHDEQYIHLLGRRGEYWVATDDEREYVMQIPMTTRVVIHGRDVEFVKDTEWRYMKFPWQEKENIRNGYGSPLDWEGSYEYTMKTWTAEEIMRRDG